MKRMTLLVAFLAITIIPSALFAGIADEKMLPHGKLSDSELTELEGYEACTMDIDRVLIVEGKNRDGNFFRKDVPAGTEMICNDEGEYTHLRGCSNRVEVTPPGTPPSGDTDCCFSNGARGNTARAQGVGNFVVGGDLVHVEGDENEVNVTIIPPSASRRRGGVVERTEGMAVAAGEEDEQSFASRLGDTSPLWLIPLLLVLAIAGYFIWRAIKRRGESDDEEGEQPAEPAAEPAEPPAPAEEPEAPAVHAEEPAAEEAEVDADNGGEAEPPPAPPAGEPEA